MNPSVNESDLERKVLLSILEDEKLARQELQESESRWRSLVQNAPDTITLVDRNAKILFINRVHPGIPVEAVVGTRLYDYMTPENRGIAERALEQAFTLGEPQEYQVIATPVAGEIHWYDNRIGPIRKGTEVETVIIITTDITERRQAEELLREKDRLLSESQRIAHIGGWSWDFKGPIIWTDETYRIYGVSKETFTPTVESLVGLVHPDDRLAMQRWIEACGAGKAPDDLVFRSISPDGSVHFLSGRGELMFDGKKRPAFIAGTVQDITEWKRAKEELIEHEKRFRSLIEHSHDAITLLAEDGTVLYDSPSVVKVLGYESTERIGKKVFQFVHPEEREEMAIGFAKFASQPGAVAASEVRFIHKDGTSRQIEGIRTNLLNEPSVRAVVVNFRDITERKKAEELLRSTMNRLMETEENIRKAASQQLHDQVGQNLTALSINLSFIRSKLSKEAEQQFGRKLIDSLSLLEDTITRIRDIMTDLRPSILDDYGLYAALAWSSVKFTERTHIPVKLTGKDLVNRPGTEIEYALFRMTQEALHNVVKHAQATQVWMDLKEEESFIILTIRDNGVGFDPGIRRKDSAGTGFGLSTISERMKALGGRFEIQSEPGKGTTLILEIKR